MTRTSPLTADEIAAVRKPYRAASLLPGRAYHDPAIFEFERSEWFRRDWVVVGREEDAAAPGTYFLAEVDDEPLIVVRGRDDVLRGFYNVCRHRGTAVVEEPCGKAVRFQCPYHAWIYDLDGSLDPSQAHRRPRRLQPRDVRAAADPGRDVAGLRLRQPGPGRRRRCRSGWATSCRTSPGSTSAALRVAHTETYEVDANWKFIAENYSECYHCPGIHPQLNKLTPYDLGGDFSPDGPWQGGWMELVDDAETMALDGGHRAGRPAMAGMTELDDRRDLLLPRLAVDLHLDPPGLRARPPARAGGRRATPGSSATGCSSRRRSPRPASIRPTRSAFWDLTNRQDWHVCELQQRGTRSRSWGLRVQAGARREALRSGQLGVLVDKAKLHCTTRKDSAVMRAARGNSRFAAALPRPARHGTAGAARQRQDARSMPRDPPASDIHSTIADAFPGDFRAILRCPVGGTLADARRRKLQSVCDQLGWQQDAAGESHASGRSHAMHRSPPAVSAAARPMRRIGQQPRPVLRHGRTAFPLARRCPRLGSSGELRAAEEGRRMLQIFNMLAERGLLPLGAFLLALLLLANEIGYRIGRWRAAARLEDAESNIGVLTAGMLGLLAFTLGLTISITKSRYEARRDLVMTEANAIGTAWLRAGLVRGAEGPEIRRELEEYTRIRLDYTRAGHDPVAEAALNAATNAAQTRIWTLAQAAALREPNPLMAGLITSLNETFDSALSQRFAYESRAPSISCGCCWPARCSRSARWDQPGLGPQRHLVLSVLLMMMWTGGMLLITDLNRPRQGQIRVDPAPLVWTLQGFSSGTPPALPKP